MVLKRDCTGPVAHRQKTLAKCVIAYRVRYNNTTGLISTKKFDQQWTLDQLGNWQEFDQDNNGDSTWDLEQSRTHNDANELTAIGLQSGGAGANWSDPAFDAAGKGVKSYWLGITSCSDSDNCHKCSTPLLSCCTKL